MFSRVARRTIALPIRRNAFATPLTALRRVTTDAASSHADRESVPEVCIEYTNIVHWTFPLTQLKQEDDKHFEVRLSDESFETYELDPPSYTLDVTKKELKQMYYDMVAVR